MKQFKTLVLVGVFALLSSVALAGNGESGSSGGRNFEPVVTTSFELVDESGNVGCERGLDEDNKQVIRACDMCCAGDHPCSDCTHARCD